jgi:hypothetical protein
VVLSALVQANRDTAVAMILADLTEDWTPDAQADLWRQVAGQHHRLREDAWARLPGVEAGRVLG